MSHVLMSVHKDAHHYSICLARRDGHSDAKAHADDAFDIHLHHVHGGALIILTEMPGLLSSQRDHAAAKQGN